MPLLLEHNKMYCPLTRNFMLHPVKVKIHGEERPQYFELEMLLQHFQNTNSILSPLYYKPIESFELDSELKEKLDAVYEKTPGEYERYEQSEHRQPEQLLQDLDKIFYIRKERNKKWSEIHPNLVRHAFFGGALTASFMLSVLNLISADPKLSILYTLGFSVAGAFISYEITMADAPHYRFFHGARQVIDIIRELNDEALDNAVFRG